MNMLLHCSAALVGLLPMNAAPAGTKPSPTATPELSAPACPCAHSFLAAGAPCQRAGENRETPWLNLGFDLRTAGEHAERDLGNGDVTDVLVPQIKLFFPQSWKPGDRRAVLCAFPGGGYGMEALRKEGTDVAQWASDLGMIGVALKYRVGGKPGTGLFPGPLLDARRCLRLLRQNARALGANPARIGVIGFSAGGHLAGMAATLWNHPLPEEEGDPLRTTACRPDFALLIYPVITMEPPIAHHGTRMKILGPHPTPERERLCSCEKQVTPETPPIFTAQSRDDGVSCANSEMMESACREQGVPVRHLLYERGGHGYGLEKRGNPTDAWPGEAEKWLRERSILPPAVSGVRSGK